MKKAALISTLLATTVCALAGWPQIAPMERSILISNVGENSIGFSSDIREHRGQLLYRLTCHSGGYENRVLVFSGLMQCYLSSAGSNQVNNLFEESDREPADWTNRARFLSFHLLPKCVNYPEWGAVRHFSLRGMEITLAATNAIYTKAPGGGLVLKSYRFSVAARPSSVTNASRPLPPTSKQPSWFYSDGCDAP